MYGEYRLLRTVGIHGGMHFCKIKVHVSKTMEKSHIFINEELKFKLSMYSDWTDAVILGVQEFLTKHSFDDLSVEIVDLLGVEVDTSPDDVKITSYMSMIAAVFPEKPLPNLEFDNIWVLPSKFI